MTEPTTQHQKIFPWWAIAAALLAAVLIGYGLGVWQGPEISNATDAAEDAKSAATAAEDASRDAEEAAHQAEENGRAACRIADGIRLLIVASPNLAETPEVRDAIQGLEDLEVTCPDQ